MAAIPALFSWSSRVAWFGLVIMGQAIVQALSGIGVGTVEKLYYY